MDCKHILSCWHKLEHFSPALLPKDSSVKRLNDLTWMRPLMARDPKKTIQYTIYLGVFSMSSVSDFVKAFFKDESINPNVTDARVCYASVKLDCQGIYIQNSFGLSTMPWALRQLEENKVDTDTWSDDFKELKDNLFERLTENQKELADDNKSYLSDVQTLENLWEIQSLIVQKLKWSTSPQTEIYIRTEEVYKKNNPSDPDESNADILNSFYIEDLKRVITSYEKGNYRKTFKDYLSACLNKDFVHSDLSLHPDILRESLIPENYPDGCWPSPYSASLMQQFAVNTVYKELSGEKQEGLFSVNGPPGTGKTTLLRDIIAAILVKRAKNMVRFNDPAKAFRKIGEVQVSEKYTPFIYEPDPSICDGGIVVTSSNNGAVENISKELPLKSEVKGYSDLVGYFRQVSEECLDEKYWGIIAAVLGNKENQRKLIGCIWNGNSEKETYTLKQHLADYKPTEEEWLGVVSSFERKLSEVKAEKSRLTGFMQNAENIEKILLKLEDIAYRLTVDEKELDTRIEVSNLLSAEIDESRRRREEVKTEMQLLRSTRPGFFTYWFSKEVRTQYKKAVASVLSEYNISGERLARQNAELQKLCTEIETLKSKWEKSKREHDEIDEQYKLLLNSVEKVREELKGAYADASFWQRIESKEVQETTPWYSETLKRLQSELFVEAMKVNELFLLRANATSSRIKTTLDGFFNFLKTGGNLTEKEIQAMWNTFWLVVPVVSSTFASIQRMFSSLGTGSIPWLFVDEAGQAVPQAAAGAIWRSKRAVIVGDPFQIEPVVTIPEQIINNFSRYFGLDKTQIHTSLSVQSMADRANPYGWVTNDTWTGSPLRVHRRCIDPMFSIANEIAYNNMMYNSTFGSIPNLIMQNGFVQIEGNVSGRHYVPEQGMAIKLMIMEEIRQLQELPDLFVISPFSEIPSILKKELRQPIRKALAPFKQIDDDTLKKWLDSHIGTVHTFQGKQAAGVIFCLGLDEKTKGAATWASSKPNLLNVALTRAKFRFVAVGDGKIWLRQPYFCKLKELV